MHAQRASPAAPAVGVDAIMRGMGFAKARRPRPGATSSPSRGGRSAGGPRGAGGSRRKSLSPAAERQREARAAPPGSTPSSRASPLANLRAKSPPRRIAAPPVGRPPPPRGRRRLAGTSRSCAAPRRACWTRRRAARPSARPALTSTEPCGGARRRKPAPVWRRRHPGSPPGSPRSSRRTRPRAGWWRRRTETRGNKSTPCARFWTTSWRTCACSTRRRKDAPTERREDFSARRRPRF